MVAQAAELVMFSPSKLPIFPKSTSSKTQYHKPMRITMLSSSSYKDSIDSDIDSYLKQRVTIRPRFEVFKPLHHLVFSTPKNLAPALCVAACEAVGGDRRDALSAAAALHLMHAAVSTHENLLVGKTGPKLKYPFGANIELLTGDGIIPLGFELLADAGQSQKQPVDSSDLESNVTYEDRVLRVILEITQAVGSKGVVDGQYQKFAADKLVHNGTICHMEELRLRKMKAKRSILHGCGAACGAILGGASEEKIEMFRQCGMFVGMINETLLDGIGNDMNKELMEFRDLAMEELEGLDAGAIELISSILDSISGYKNYKIRSGMLHSCAA